MDGADVLGDFGFGILVQLRLVPVEAQQLGHKEDLSRVRGHLHPHSGINVKLIVRVPALLRRLDLRLLIEKVK